MKIDKSTLLLILVPLSVYANDFDMAVNVIKVDEEKKGNVFFADGRECFGQNVFESRLSQTLLIDKNTKAILFTSEPCMGNVTRKHLVIIKNNKAKLVKNLQMADENFLGDMSYFLDRSIFFHGDKWLKNDAHCCPSKKAQLQFNVDTNEQILKIDD